MPSITFRLWQGTGLFSRSIGWFGGAGFTHVDTLTKDGKSWRGARDDTYVYETDSEMIKIPSGYYDRPLFYQDGRVHGALSFELDVTAEEESAYWDWSDKQLRKKYDQRGILGLALGKRNWHADDQWFCSEAVAAGGEIAGFFPPIFEGYNRVDPGDIGFMLCMLVPKIKRFPYFAP